MPKPVTTVEFLERAYGALECAMCTLKTDYRSRKFSKRSYEAIEEEMAHLCKDVRNLATALGFKRGATRPTEGQQ